jgi:formylglycine-generating enzyme required for sulfatase activity
MTMTLKSSCVLLHVLSVGAATAVGKDFKNYAEKMPRTLVTFDMIAVPEGSIELPAEGGSRPRTVKVKRFWIGKTEVTFDELDAFRLGLEFAEDVRNDRMSALVDAKARPSSPYHNPACGFGQQGYAALTVTHHHAQAYCKWLSEKTRRKYRLPTEIEWEYACRAGAAERAMDRKELDAVAWHRENSVTAEFEEGKTHPAATKKPNAWGLHDMLGSVWEWCTTEEGKPVAGSGSFEQRPERLHPRVRMTDFDRWTVSDPADPKSRWWLSDGKSAGFRVVREVD